MHRVARSGRREKNLIMGAPVYGNPTRVDDLPCRVDCPASNLTTISQTCGPPLTGSVT